MLGHYTECACFTSTSQALMVCTFILWTVGEVMVSGVKLFAWVHKNVSVHPKTYMMP